MAKSVKEKGPAEVEVSERAVKSLTKRVFEQLDNLETSKAQHMNRARRIREAMSVVYEGAAAEGIPQKIAKLHVKIIRTVEQIKGWMAELEAEEQSLARKMAKAQGNKGQLALWSDLPVLKVTKAAVVETAEKAKKSAAKKTSKAAPGATGQDIDDAEKAAEAARVADAENEGAPAVLN